MTAADLAHGEQGYVVDLAGWWLLAILALLVVAFWLASWYRHTERRNRYRDIDRLARKARP